MNSFRNPDPRCCEVDRTYDPAMTGYEHETDPPGAPWREPARNNRLVEAIREFRVMHRCSLKLAKAQVLQYVSAYKSAVGDIETTSINLPGNCTLTFKRDPYSNAIKIYRTTVEEVGSARSMVDLVAMVAEITQEQTMRHSGPRG